MSNEVGHKCPECPKIFKLKSDLNHHSTAKHRNKANARFTCPQCDFAAYYEGKLKSHIASVHEKQKKFKCEECSDYKTANRSHLRQHVDSVHRQIRHTCDQCESSFASKDGLRHHTVTRHGDGGKKIVCDICDFRTSANVYLKNHMLNMHTVTKDEKESFSCDVCDKVFSKKTYLQRHKLRHTKPLVAFCPDCNKGFRTTQEMHGHRNSVHLDLTSYECKECGAKLKSKRGLHLHTQAVHRKVKSHVCQICNIGLSSKRSIQGHMFAIHRTEEKGRQVFQCDHCPKLFAESTGLKRHVNQVHLKLNPVTCDFCDFKSSSKDSLKCHVDRVHSLTKRFKCDLCEYRAYDKSDMNKHVRGVHLGEKAKFPCKFCDKKLSSKSILEKHVEIRHTVAKPRHCDICDLSTSCEKSLEAHIRRIHGKEQETAKLVYPCETCDYSSARMNDLKAHIQGVHLKIKPFKCDNCDYASARKGDLKIHIGNVHAK